MKLNFFDIFGQMGRLEIRWTTPATELFGRAMGRSMRIRSNDFQARNELAGSCNGKSRKLVTTP